jgi:hypothetical protein
MRDFRVIIASTLPARICWSGLADSEAAIGHYRRAVNRTTSIPERNYLASQAARLSDARK